MSQHPVDRLIRELASSPRKATKQEVRAILGRLAEARFSEHLLVTPSELRAVLDDRATSLEIHWAMHVRKQKQWAAVTASEYLADLQNAAREPDAHLAVYNPPKGPVAAILAPSTLPSERLGESALPYLWVVYGATFGTLITGYQVSGLNRVSILGEVQWLK